MFNFQYGPPANITVVSNTADINQIAKTIRINYAYIMVSCVAKEFMFTIEFCKKLIYNAKLNNQNVDI